MSMSIHLYAIRDDEHSAKYAAIYKHCEELDIEVPDEVQEFFGYAAPPDDGAAAVSLYDKTRKFSDQDGDFREVNIADLPPGTKAIRVKISY